VRHSASPIDGDLGGGFGYKHDENRIKTKDKKVRVLTNGKEKLTKRIILYVFPRKRKKVSASSKGGEQWRSGESRSRQKREKKQRKKYYNVSTRPVLKERLGMTFAADIGKRVSVMILVVRRERNLGE